MFLDATDGPNSDLAGDGDRLLFIRSPTQSCALDRPRMPIDKVQLVRAIRPGVQNVKRHRRTIRLHDTDVIPAKLTRFRDAAGMRKNLDLMHHVAAVIRGLDRLVGGIEPPLEAGVVRRDAGGAGILVTFQRLNAPEGEHESACRDDKIRART